MKQSKFSFDWTQWPIEPLRIFKMNLHIQWFDLRWLSLKTLIRAKVSAIYVFAVIFVSGLILVKKYACIWLWHIYWDMNVKFLIYFVWNSCSLVMPSNSFKMHSIVTNWHFQPTNGLKLPKTHSIKMLLFYCMSEKTLDLKISPDWADKQDPLHWVKLCCNCGLRRY